MGSTVTESFFHFYAPIREIQQLFITYSKLDFYRLPSSYSICPRYNSVHELPYDTVSVRHIRCPPPIIQPSRYTFTTVTSYVAYLHYDSSWFSIIVVENNNNIESINRSGSQKALVMKPIQTAAGPRVPIDLRWSGYYSFVVQSIT